jgi:hypothetical protein
MQDNGSRPMNRIGMKHSASPLLKMSFETTCTFLIDATAGADSDNLESPSSRLILGRPVSYILFIVHFVYCILNPFKDLHLLTSLALWIVHFVYCILNPFKDLLLD